MKTNDGKQGGMLDGKTHKEGGMPALITNDGSRPVELETKEAIINATSMEMDEKVKCEGTPKEIASAINELGGGVKFAAGASCEPATLENGGAIIQTDSKYITMTIPDNLYYIKPGNRIKDVDGTQFEIMQLQPDGILVKRYSVIDKTNPELSLTFDNIIELFSSKQASIEGKSYETERDHLLLLNEINEIKCAYALADYQNRLTESEARIAELKQFVPIVPTLKENLASLGKILKDGGQLPVANEIRKQLGGKALYMLGAQHLADDEKSLQFSILGSKKFNKIKIELNGKHLYDITFYKIVKLDIKDKKTVYNVYNDQLHAVIEKETGLVTKLAKGGKLLPINSDTQQLLDKIKKNGMKEDYISEGEIFSVTKKSSDGPRFPIGKKYILIGLYADNYAFLMPLDKNDKVGLDTSINDLIKEYKYETYEPNFKDWFPESWKQDYKKIMNEIHPDIKNQYEGKTPEQVWAAWNEKQRIHFLEDHKTEIGTIMFAKPDSGEFNYKQFVKNNFEGLPFGIQDTVRMHISEGQYEAGGTMQASPKAYFAQLNLMCLPAGADELASTIMANEQLQELPADNEDFQNIQSCIEENYHEALLPGDASMIEEDIEISPEENETRITDLKELVKANPDNLRIKQDLINNMMRNGGPITRSGQVATEFYSAIEQLARVGSYLHKQGFKDDAKLEKAILQLSNIYSDNIIELNEKFGNGGNVDSEIDELITRIYSEKNGRERIIADTIHWGVYKPYA